VLFFGTLLADRDSPRVPLCHELGKPSQKSELNRKGATVSDPTPVVPTPPAQSGLSDNAAGALAYVTVIPAIIFLLVEPYNKSSYIKFHAWQSVFLTVAFFAVSIVAIIPILGWLIAIIGIPVLLIAWIICLVNALQGKRFKLPWIGNLAEKQVGA